MYLVAADDPKNWGMESTRTSNWKMNMLVIVTITSQSMPQIAAKGALMLLISYQRVMYENSIHWLSKRVSSTNF